MGEMRFWFSGPRLFGGFVRPGVSFGPRDFFGRSSSERPSGIVGSHVYVITNEIGHQKIGVSVGPPGRLADLQTGSSLELNLAFVARTAGSGYDIEDAAHVILDRYKLRGEWFAVTPNAAIAAVYAGAEQVGQPIEPVDPAFPIYATTEARDAADKRWIASPIGWLLLLMLGAYIWRGFVGQ